MSEAAKIYLNRFKYRMARAGYNVRVSYKRGTAAWGTSKLTVRDLPSGDLIAETTTFVRGTVR
jgi:hypothetical protein